MQNNPSAYKQPVKIDTDINNYTLSDMLTILNLGTQPTTEQIMASTNQYISQATKSNNTELSQFFQDAQTALLQYIQPNPETGDNTYQPAEKKTLAWWNNEALPQPDANQNSKITTRKQEIQLFDNDHVPMNRQQLGVNNNFNVSVAQDTLNPNLTNQTTRFINLDSQFRQATAGIESSSSDYTLDLSEPLNNVLSMWLYSIQVPHTWYTYDNKYGNTCLWILFDPSDPLVYVKISISPGNYTASEIVSQMNLREKNGFSSSYFNWEGTGSLPSATFPVSYNANNGKITMNLYGGIYTDPNTGTEYKMNSTTQILFFDTNSEFKCDTKGACSQQNTINQTFGWYLGYRVPFVYVSSSGNTADTIINTYGPKYIIVVIDDYNQNHINNGLVTITEGSTSIKLPTYYDASMPVKCIKPLTTDPSLNTQNGLLLLEKMNISYKKVPQVLPTAPRILTQAQIYSINEIQKNNETNTSFRGKAPTNPNIFALIPVKLNVTEATTTSSVYIEFSGSLQENKRIYFGPVNIERLRVKLLDDKGNLLNLNGSDWSLTIICDILYQY